MDPYSLQLDLAEICLRLLCAILIGTVIGIEREYTHRPAGLRTHMIVALGSSSVMITSELLVLQYASTVNVDPARLPAQVIAGVGFLGAGTILREGANVKGLTTAASLWTVACLGLAAGAGYYRASLIGTALMFVILTLFERLQSVMFCKRKRSRRFFLLCSDLGAVMSLISEQLEKQDAAMTHIQLGKDENGLHTVDLSVTFRGRSVQPRIQAFTTILASQESVQSLRTNFDRE